MFLTLSHSIDILVVENQGVGHGNGFGITGVWSKALVSIHIFCCALMLATKGFCFPRHWDAKRSCCYWKGGSQLGLIYDKEDLHI